MKTNDEVAQVHAALEAIDLADVPVLNAERSMRRKDQAALARKLFRSLNPILRHVSFTAPSYSMASSVHVGVPCRGDYTRDSRGEVDWTNDPAGRANHNAKEKVQAILNRAFPSHVDRSEYISDHFDFCWSMN